MLFVSFRFKWSVYKQQNVNNNAIFSTLIYNEWMNEHEHWTDRKREREEKKTQVEPTYYSSPAWTYYINIESIWLIKIQPIPLYRANTKRKRFWSVDKASKQFSKPCKYICFCLSIWYSVIGFMCFGGVHVCCAVLFGMFGQWILPLISVEISMFIEW